MLFFSLFNLFLFLLPTFPLFISALSLTKFRSFPTVELTLGIYEIGIGIELAEQLCGDRFEIIVATHCNTGCYYTDKYAIFNGSAFAGAD